MCDSGSPLSYIESDRLPVFDQTQTCVQWLTVIITTIMIILVVSGQYSHLAFAISYWLSGICNQFLRQGKALVALRLENFAVRYELLDNVFQANFQLLVLAMSQRLLQCMSQTVGYLIWLLLPMWTCYRKKNIQKILKYESWVEENCLRKIKCLLEITY